MNSIRFRFLTGLVFILSLSACATTAQRMFESAGGGDTILPSQSVVESDLKGSSYELGSVHLSIDAANSQFVLPEDAYVKLMRHQLAKAFERAGVVQGTIPATTVNVAIERMQFIKGGWLFSSPSVLRARMEIVRPDKGVLLRGSVECVDFAAVTFPLGGILIPIAVPHSSESMAHAKLIPAVASLLASIVRGLQEGNTPEAITLLPDDFPSPPATYVLQQSKLGLTPLTKADTEEVTGLSLPKEDD